MQGYYEYSRDNYRVPSCWKAVDNACAPHFHSSIELLYVTKGEIHVALNGWPAKVEEGCFLISPSYAVHYYQTEGHSSAYVLTVPLEVIPSYKALLAKKTFTECCSRDRSDGEILHCLERLCSLTADTEKMESLSGRNTVKGYIYVLLGHVIEETGLRDFTESPNASLARDILSYLQDNYQKEITLDSLAQTFGYSKSRFSHLFHRYFGSGISEYVNDLRCRSAVEAITEQDLSMVDIAMSVGFESTRTFYRAFRRCYGMTPSEYASRHMVGEAADEVKEESRDKKAASDVETACMPDPCQQMQNICRQV